MRMRRKRSDCRTLLDVRFPSIYRFALNVQTDRGAAQEADERIKGGHQALATR